MTRQHECTLALLASLTVVAGCGGYSTSGLALVPTFRTVEDLAPSIDRARSRGVAWGDFDGDGDPDLFVTRASYDPDIPSGGNVLYRNDGVLGFARLDVAPTRDRDGDSEGAAWVDVDNDGDLDLHVVGRSGTGSVLYENRSAGTFERVTPDPLGGRVTSASMACWADADADGLLDVFVVGYGSDDNRLFRGSGDWGFTEAPLPDAGRGPGTGRACAWGDIDGDGLPELLIATARRSNVLLRNRGGLRFEADTTTALQSDRGYGYGLSWTDVNGDGNRDLFVANFDGPNFLYFGTGGVLEASSVGGRLTSAASKGHTWGDFDQDGYEDLYLGSGTPAEGMRNRLYRGAAHAGFISLLTGDPVEHADTSAGIAWADYDLDGDLDIFVANWGGQRSRNRLYQNTSQAGHWLKVRLEGRQSNRMGIGARASVFARIDGEARWLHRWLDASTGYAGQNEPVLHFGLGTTTEVDSVRVTWPSGIVDCWGRTSARRTLHLVEGTGAENTLPAGCQR